MKSDKLERKPTERLDGLECRLAKLERRLIDKYECESICESVFDKKTAARIHNQQIWY